MYAFRRTNRRAQFAPDALFHSVFVTVQNMATVQTLGLVDFDIHLFGIALLATKHSAARILRCHAVLRPVLSESN
jgi:hypothetical protein